MISYVYVLSNYLYDVLSTYQENAEKKSEAMNSGELTEMGSSTGL